MWIRLAVLIAVSAVLCGCILQAKAPVFSENQAQLALGKSGGTARMFTWKDGAWVADAGAFKVAVSDRHYEVATEKETVSLAFVPVTGPWFAVQAHEGTSAPAYMMAQIKAGSAELWPISCQTLKAADFHPQWVEYKGDDCYIRPDAPAQELFAALAATLGTDHATSRLEIIR